MSRTPMIELVPTAPQEQPSSEVSSTHSVGETSINELSKDTGQASNIHGKETMKRRCEYYFSVTPFQLVNAKTLIPRQPLEIIHVEDKKRKGTIPSTSALEREEPHEADLDQELLNHAFNSAITIVENYVCIQ